MVRVSVWESLYCRIQGLTVLTSWVVPLLYGALLVCRKAEDEVNQAWLLLSALKSVAWEQCSWAIAFWIGYWNLCIYYYYYLLNRIVNLWELCWCWSSTRQLLVTPLVHHAFRFSWEFLSPQHVLYKVVCVSIGWPRSFLCLLPVFPGFPCVIWIGSADLCVHEGMKEGTVNTFHSEYEVGVGTTWSTVSRRSRFSWQFLITKLMLSEMSVTVNGGSWLYKETH